MASVCNYYVGLKINDVPDHHNTLIFLKDVTDETVDAVIATIGRYFDGKIFAGAGLRLLDEDMFGPKKDIRVRKLEYDLSLWDGRLIFDLAKELYDAYGNKDYPQNPHISAIKTPEDTIVFENKSLVACQLFVKRLGSDPKYIYTNPPS